MWYCLKTRKKTNFSPSSYLKYTTTASMFLDLYSFVVFHDQQYILRRHELFSVSWHGTNPNWPYCICSSFGKIWSFTPLKNITSGVHTFHVEFISLVSPVESVEYIASVRHVASGLTWCRPNSEMANFFLYYRIILPINTKNIFESLSKVDKVLNYEGFGLAQRGSVNNDLLFICWWEDGLKRGWIINGV